MKGDSIMNDTSKINAHPQRLRKWLIASVIVVALLALVVSTTSSAATPAFDSGNGYTADLGVYNLIADSTNDHTNARYVWQDGNYVYVALTTMNHSLSDAKYHLEVDGITVDYWDELPDVRNYPDNTNLVVKDGSGAIVIDEAPYGKNDSGAYYWMIGAIEVSEIPAQLLIALNFPGGFELENTYFQVLGSLNVFHEYPPADPIIDLTQTEPVSFNGLQVGTYEKNPVSIEGYDYLNVVVEIDGEEVISETSVGNTVVDQAIPSGEGTVSVSEDGTVTVDLTSEYYGAIDIYYSYFALTPITITAGSQTWEYDGNAHSFDSVTVTSGSLNDGDYLVASSSGSITNVADSPVTNAIDAGYAIMNDDGTEGDTSDDYDVTTKYDITIENGQLNLTASMVTITVNDAEKFFGEADPVFTGSITSGALVDGNDLGTISYYRTNTSEESVGVYMEVLSANYTANSNYDVTIMPGDFEIKDNSTGEELEAYGGAWLYDGNAHAVMANAPTGYTIYYKVGTGEWSSTAPSVTNVSEGIVTVSVKALQEGNEDLFTDDVTIQVTARSVTLTSGDATKVYDGTALLNHTVAESGDGFVQGEGATFNVTGSQTSVGSSDNTFTYTLNEVTLAENYIIAKVLGTLRVTEGGNSVTVSSPDASKMYDGTALTTGESSYTYSDTLVQGDVLTAMVTGTITDAGTAANTITDIAIMRGTDDVTSAYNITKEEGTLTITQVDITITVDDGRKTVRRDDPEFTGSITSGTLVSPDDLGTITYIRANSDESVGTYDGVITADFTENFNYNVTVIPGDFRIKAKRSSTSSGGVLGEEDMITDHYAYIIGFDDGFVYPEAPITRAEVATIFFRMLNDSARDSYWSQSNKYADVESILWYNNAISTLTKGSIVEGHPNGNFYPNSPITRAELATMTSRFYGGSYTGSNDWFSDINGHWAVNYINHIAENGLIAGYPDGTFKPDNNITRAEAIRIINNLLGRSPEKDHMLDGMITWPDNADENKWYYPDIQEATNSHNFMYESGDVHETWTELLPVRDWAALEAEWSNANSSENPGEVLS